MLAIAGEPSAPKLEGQMGEDGNSIKVNLIKQDDGGSPIRHYLVKYRAVSSSHPQRHCAHPGTLIPVVLNQELKNPRGGEDRTGSHQTSCGRLLECGQGFKPQD